MKKVTSFFFLDELKGMCHIPSIPDIPQGSRCRTGPLLTGPPGVWMSP